MLIEKIIKNFKLNGDIVEVKENNTGIINNTYIVSVMENGILKKYTLQKVNTVVFEDPYLLMNNICSVTDYCKDFLDKNGEDAERGTLSVIRTKDDNIVYKTDDGEYYRMYNYTFYLYIQN